MPSLPIACRVCDDSGEARGSPCPRCRKRERADHFASKKAAEAKRQSTIDPRRWLAQVQQHSKAKDRAYLLAVILATRADRNGRVSVPPDALASICRCKRRTVFILLANLIALGELITIRRGGGKGRHAIHQFTKFGCRSNAPKLAHLVSVANAPKSL